MGNKCFQNERPSKPRQSGPPSTKAAALLDSSPHSKYTQSMELMREYVRIGHLGNGGFAEVSLVRSMRNNKLYALKAISKRKLVEQADRLHIQAERRIMAKTTHTFLVQIHRAFQTPDMLYFVLDFAEGGDFFLHLRRQPDCRVSLEAARFYTAEIVCAIAYLHSQGIVYRDLKPENVLIGRSGHIMLTDFGISAELAEGSRLDSFTGTESYMPPEIIKGAKYGKTVDWYALGTLLFEMLAGRLPFEVDASRGQGVRLLYELILQADTIVPSHVDSIAADLVIRLMEKNPDKRLGANGAAEVMGHEFFAGIDWGVVEARGLRPPWVPELGDSQDSSCVLAYFGSNAMLKDSEVDLYKEDSACMGFATVGTHIDQFTLANTPIGKGYL